MGSKVKFWLPWQLDALILLRLPLYIVCTDSNEFGKKTHVNRPPPHFLRHIHLDPSLKCPERKLYMHSMDGFDPEACKVE